MDVDTDGDTDGDTVEREALEERDTAERVDLVERREATVTSRKRLLWRSLYSS